MAPEPPSRFIAFFDECGDHSLEKINPEFPLFVLSTVVVEREHYVKEIVPAFAELKLDYWDHEGVNLHSRDIRKQIGPFAYLQIPSLRPEFLSRVTSLMRRVRFHLFITAIRKPDYLAAHGDGAANPYDVAVARTMEGLLELMKSEGETTLPMIAEARGRVEDNALETAFYRLLATGTESTPAEAFQSLRFPMTFVNKERNVAGTQLADLCGYPSARHILKPSQPNQAFDVVRAHVYRQGATSGWVVMP